MTTMLRAAGYAALACACGGSAARAQDVRGLVVGFHGEAVQARADALTATAGIGVGALLGFGVSTHVVPLLDLGFGFAESRVLAYANLAGRVYAPPLGRMVPYGEVGFAAHGRELDDERVASGLGLSLGLGVEYFLRPHRSIVLSAHRWAGRYDEIENGTGSTPADIAATSTRIGVGMYFRPPRRR